MKVLLVGRLFLELYYVASLLGVEGAMYVCVCFLFYGLSVVGLAFPNADKLPKNRNTKEKKELHSKSSLIICNKTITCKQTSYLPHECLRYLNLPWESIEAVKEKQLRSNEKMKQSNNRTMKQYVRSIFIFNSQYFNFGYQTICFLFLLFLRKKTEK